MSINLFTLATGLISWFQNYRMSFTLTIVGALFVTFTLLFWLRDVVKESAYLGYHTLLVQMGLKLGFYLFVVSEVFVFFSVFWAFFYASLSPNVEIGCVFPSVGITAFDPWSVPLLNTVILLTSGVSLTWAHRSTVKKNRLETIVGLGITLILGLIFTMFQVLEYREATFTITDSIYGATFFSATGLHGLHVIVGTLLLFAQFFRVFNYEISNHRHLGFELSILY